MKKSNISEMPVSLRMKEATQEIVKKINEVSKEYQLPFFLLDKIVLDLHQEIQNEMLKEEQLYYEKIEKDQKGNDK